MGTADLLHAAVDRDDGVLPFASRAHAGALLGRRLTAYRGLDPLVLGIPRGGVAVAAGVAAALDAELDVVVVRKLGAPMQPELAIGAITADGTRHVAEDIARQLGVTTEYLSAISRAEQAEARRREERFRGSRRPPRVRGRAVIIVDDGLATGASMVVALHAVRREHPAKLVVAVPVGSREACDAVSALADEVVCLAHPEPFEAVGLYYWSFPQLEDREVDELLADARTLR